MSAKDAQWQCNKTVLRTCASIAGGALRAAAAAAAAVAAAAASAAICSCCWQHCRKQLL